MLSLLALASFLILVYGTYLVFRGSEDVETGVFWRVMLVFAGFSLIYVGMVGIVVHIVAKGMGG